MLFAEASVFVHSAHIHPEPDLLQSRYVASLQSHGRHTVEHEAQRWNALVAERAIHLRQNLCGSLAAKIEGGVQRHDSVRVGHKILQVLDFMKRNGLGIARKRSMREVAKACRQNICDARHTALWQANSVPLQQLQSALDAG